MTVQDSIYSPTDLAEADRLISDLAALVDAGLVAVEENLLGPARYGVVEGTVDFPRASEDSAIPLRRDRRLLT